MLVTGKHRPSIAAGMATVIVLLVLGLVFSARAPAQQALTLTGAPGPGPAHFDRIFVDRFGPADAPTALILLPSRAAGAGSLTLVAQDLVAAVPGLQVWTVDFRWQALEDTSVFAAGDPDAAFAYYLAFQAVGGRTFHPVAGTSAPFVRDWGLALEVADVRRVVRAARSRGARRVVLGGLGSGADASVAYAAWDFAGRPGYRDLDGLVLIDSSIQPGLSAISRRSAQRSLDFLRTGDPFAFLLKGLPPWAAGVFLETGALYALTRPQEPSALESYPLLPHAFLPPVRVTNQALLGYAIDRSTNPASFAVFRVHAGGLAAAGDPRPWQDGELTPIERVAQTYAQEPTNAISWYWPKRLDLDLDAAAALGRDPAARLLGLRLRYLSTLDVPIYGFQTEATRAFFLHNLHVLIDRTRVPARQSMLVDRATTTSPLDPLLAAPATNDFTKTVARFLARVANRRQALSAP
jgi:hypothetical protein